MKRQSLEWEKIFSNHISDKRLISKIYKELIQFNRFSLICLICQSGEMLDWMNHKLESRLLYLSQQSDVQKWKELESLFQRRQWPPTPGLLPGKPHGRRSLVGCSPWGCEELDTTEQLHFHFSLSFNREGNGNPLQCSCLENPRDGGTWWAAVYAFAQSWTRLKRLSSSSREPLAEGKRGEWKSWLETQHSKTKIMVCGPITSWQIEGEKVEAVIDFIFLGSKITADGDCSHGIKRHLLLGGKAVTNLDSVLKSRDITLATKVHIVKAMVFPVSSVQSLSHVQLCNPMDCSTLGLPVHQQLPEFTQTHVHRVSDATQ